MSDITALYRYKDVVYTSCEEEARSVGRVVAVLIVFKVLRETPQGFWTDTGQWVSKTSRKRLAYPSKEEAWKAFIARKRRQITILEHRLKRARAAVSLTRPEDGSVALV